MAKPHSTDMADALTGKRVFITGASGFIGQRVVPALQASGAKLTLLSRSRAVNGANLIHVRGDLGNSTLLRTHLQGQEILINLAYDVRASGANNLAAFDALMQAAAKVGITRIIHISSIVVYDGWPDHDLDENSPMQRPGGGPYRQTKIAMEQNLISGTTPTAILQPTIVYGPKSALWTDQLAQALVAGGVLLPTPDGLCNGVFVDDVAQAILRACIVTDLKQERFIISGPQTFTWSDLLHGYAAILGRGKISKVPRQQLQDKLGPKPAEQTDDTPGMAARISALARNTLGHARFEALVRRARRHLAKPGPMQPDHHLLGVLSGAGTCKIAHARKRLGYDPQFDLPRGLAATHDHLTTLARSK